MRKVIPIILLFLFLCGKEEHFSTHIRIGSEYIEVTGVGASPANNEYSEAELKKIAAETAYYLALSKLAAVLSGIKIDGVFTVKDMGNYSSQIVERIRAKITGIEEIENQFRKLDDGSWEATSKIRIKKNKGIQILKEVAPEKNFASIMPEITSFIFDISEFKDKFNILSVFKIYDKNGNLIYSPAIIKEEVLLSGQYFVIFPNLNKLMKQKEIVGSSPQIIKIDSIDKNRKILYVNTQDSKLIQDNFILIREGKIFFAI